MEINEETVMHYYVENDDFKEQPIHKDHEEAYLKWANKKLDNGENVFVKYEHDEANG